MRNKDRFRIIPGDEPLTEADFIEWPAWSEHYDFEDIELIASWGIDRDWIAQQFRDMNTGGSHPHFTILDLEHLPHENMRIFLKAEFRHGSGLVIPGIIMNSDAFYIELFVGEEIGSFSRHPSLGSEMMELKRRLEKKLGVDELFPLRYFTPFRDSDGRIIEGEFSLPD